ncbi:MAG: pilus assembly protein [Planctomycetales bacterium]|nr:pilus assembly protein [Planctomycetales bacterium]
MFDCTVPSRRPICRSRRTDRRGVAAVEFAVCLPVIVLLVLGAIEATNMVFLKQSLSVAAYEGGRTAVVPDATDADVIAKCQEILNERRVNGANIAITPDPVEDLGSGEYIHIEVSAPCTGNTLLSGSIYRGRSMTVFSEFMKEF